MSQRAVWQLAMGIVVAGSLAGTAHAQLGDSQTFLNSMDLNLSQYSERMGLSLWSFNQNLAGTEMGSSREVNARGRARIKAGKASVSYRPVAANMGTVFAASRSRDPAKRRELAKIYTTYLGRFRDAQRKERLGEHNVAAALGLAFASNYEIYSDGQATNSTQDRDVVAQFRSALLKDTYFQGTTDRYRQLLDENTAVQTVASLVLYRNAARRGDKEAVEAERKQALAFLDFYWPGDEDRARKIRLTAGGFRD